jgi:hypothetical protein
MNEKRPMLNVNQITIALGEKKTQCTIVARSGKIYNVNNGHPSVTVAPPEPIAGVMCNYN